MRFLTVLLLGTLCVGCDPIYGVRHSAIGIGRVPADSCVVDALKTIPGITDVTSTDEDSKSEPLTLHGVEKPDQLHRFFYRYQGVADNLFLAVSYNGKTSYEHAFLTMGRRPPQEIVDRLYPSFKLVDLALESQCGVSDVGGVVKESCMGVRCGGV
jgi:hypothetical protein